MTQLKDRFMYHPTVEDTAAVHENTRAHCDPPTLQRVRGASHQDTLAEAINIQLQTGNLRTARDLAQSVRALPTADRALVQASAEAFEACLDFPAAGEMTARLLAFSQPSSVERSTIERRVTLFVELNDQAIALGYRGEDLLAVPEYFVQSLRDREKRIQSVRLRGTLTCSVLLEFGIDATGDECIPLFFEVAGALVRRFGDRSAVELVPCELHSYAEEIGDALADSSLSRGAR